jgi:hypothetical protein
MVALRRAKKGSGVPNSMATEAILWQTPKPVKGREGALDFFPAF